MTDTGTLAGITMTLRIGGMNPSPVSTEVARAVQAVTVNVTDDGPCGFQIDLNAERSALLMNDYPLVANPLLKPFNRVLISVAVGLTSTVLIDGFVTHQQLVPGSAGRGATLTLIGEDVSVLMDMIDVTIPYPALGDALIVGAVLAKWALIGVLPEIVPPIASPISDPLVSTTIQNGTDRAYLTCLAKNYGYIFGVRPGTLPLTNIAYWGPPLRLTATQPALSVDLGPETNVDSLSFEHDAITPTLVFGAALDPMTDSLLPIATLMSTREPPLSARPALTAYEPFGRKTLYSESTFSSLRAFMQAQGTTDVSTDNAVTAKGTVDTLRYGHVIRAPGVVGVRGAGSTYDGKYYVKSVTHKLAPGSYTQDFMLSREGLGTTVSTLPV